MYAKERRGMSVCTLGLNNAYIHYHLFIDATGGSRYCFIQYDLSALVSELILLMHCSFMSRFGLQRTR